MTNIDRWPEAFDSSGNPKVGGRWQGTGGVWEVTGIGDNHWIGVKDTDTGSRSDAYGPWFAIATFLGFSAPAPEVKLPVWREGQRLLFKGGDGWAARAGAIAVVARDLRDGDVYVNVAWEKSPLAGIQSDGDYRPAQFDPAPVASPSPKAVLPDPVLTIPPQPGTRHEAWERLMRMNEAAGDPIVAREHAVSARTALAADLAYDAEASAIRENRIVRKDALKAMGAGDRACYAQRGLREFAAIVSETHKAWMWWEAQ